VCFSLNDTESRVCVPYVLSCGLNRHDLQTVSYLTGFMLVFIFLGRESLFIY
jgi:hypothetical protein